VGRAPTGGSGRGRCTQASAPLRRGPPPGRRPRYRDHPAPRHGIADRGRGRSIPLSAGRAPRPHRAPDPMSRTDEGERGPFVTFGSAGYTLSTSLTRRHSSAFNAHARNKAVKSDPPRPSSVGCPSASRPTKPGTASTGLVSSSARSPERSTLTGYASSGGPTVFNQVAHSGAARGGNPLRPKRDFQERHRPRLGRCEQVGDLVSVSPPHPARPPSQVAHRWNPAPQTRPPRHVGQL
jgi:hypothetical protein